MTLSEWTTAVTAVLKQRGFTVKEVQGFPIACEPMTYDQRFMICEHRGWQGMPTSFKTVIYKEGALFLPAEA